MSREQRERWVSGYHNKADTLREKAHRMLGHEIAAARGAVPESMSSPARTKMRPFRKGGHALNEGQENLHLPHRSKTSPIKSESFEQAEHKKRGGRAEHTKEKTAYHKRHGKNCYGFGGSFLSSLNSGLNPLGPMGSLMGEMSHTNRNQAEGFGRSLGNFIVGGINAFHGNQQQHKRGGSIHGRKQEPRKEVRREALHRKEERGLEQVKHGIAEERRLYHKKHGKNSYGIGGFLNIATQAVPFITKTIGNIPGFKDAILNGALNHGFLSNLPQSQKDFLSKNRSYIYNNADKMLDDTFKTANNFVGGLSNVLPEKKGGSIKKAHKAAGGSVGNPDPTEWLNHLSPEDNDILMEHLSNRAYNTWKSADKVDNALNSIGNFLSGKKRGGSAHSQKYKQEMMSYEKEHGKNHKAIGGGLLSAFGGVDKSFNPNGGNLLSNYVVPQISGLIRRIPGGGRVGNKIIGGLADSVDFAGGLSGMASDIGRKFIGLKKGGHMKRKASGGTIYEKNMVGMRPVTKRKAFSEGGEVETATMKRGGRSHRVPRGHHHKRTSYESEIRGEYPIGKTSQMKAKKYGFGGEALSSMQMPNNSYRRLPVPNGTPLPRVTNGTAPYSPNRSFFTKLLADWRSGKPVFKNNTTDTHYAPESQPINYIKPQPINYAAGGEAETTTMKRGGRSRKGELLSLHSLKGHHHKHTRYESEMRGEHPVSRKAAGGVAKIRHNQATAVGKPRGTRKVKNNMF